MIHIRSRMRRTHCVIDGGRSQGGARGLPDRGEARRGGDLGGSLLETGDTIGTGDQCGAAGTSGRGGAKGANLNVLMSI